MTNLFLRGAALFDDPYLETPTIPPGQTVATYRHNRRRRRTPWQRFVDRCGAAPRKA